MVGVAIGTFLQSSTITGLGPRWLPVAVVSIATLIAAIAAGLALARLAPLDRPTASLGMIAGGASGMVAMADELGADSWLVAFMQYLRVFVITLLTPALVAVAFAGTGDGSGGIESGPLLGTGAAWAFMAGVAGIGAIAGFRLRLPAPALLGPLIVAGALSLAGLTGELVVPPLARECAFAIIGLQIGLAFRRDVLRRMADLLLPVAATIGALLVACFGLAALLAATADVSLLDGYLATTPGGLYVVLPIAQSSGADATFVLAVQGMRLVAMMIAAPLIVRYLIRTGGRRDRTPSPLAPDEAGH